MGLLGWLLYVLGVRPFAGRPGMAWVMSTLGFGVILQSVGLAIWGPKPVVVPGPVGDAVIRVARRRHPSAGTADAAGGGGHHGRASTV
jgi:branched-chain amino acid transport system permease protein